MVSPSTVRPASSDDRELQKIQIFGTPVTCNIARHAYCSALNTALMSTKQLEDIAALMGHSITTH